MVKFENIEIKYGDFVAIENLNLDIKEGEFLLLFRGKLVTKEPMV